MEEHKCSNCGERTRVDRALTVTTKGRQVAVICETCQKAKKIQITLQRGGDGWEFFQYFPVEA